MRERHILRAWPLTPIHIGTGEELTAESFVLEDDRLRTFNGFAALSGATEADRTQYQKLLKGGDYTGAQKHLAGLARKAGSLGETISVARDTVRDLEKVLNGQSIGRGGIRPFIRDGGTSILPGSSLKGAFRTAWIDHTIKDKWTQKPTNPRNTSKEARAVNEAALDIEKTSALEQDPFRDVAVSDAPVPPGRTRYDRATLGKLDRERPKLNFDQTGGMHVERLISLADGGKVAPFEIKIDMASASFAKRREAMGRREDRRDQAEKRIVPKVVIGAKELWVAANRFHADLWRYERERFYKESPAARLLDRLLAAFGLSDEENLAQHLDAEGLVLLRVGRYSQFESKAVRLNGKRYGIKASTRTKDGERKPECFLEKGGTTRTTAKVAKEINAPFGWLLLALPGKGPQGAVTARLADLSGASSGQSRADPHGPVRGGSRSAPPTPSQPALAGQFRFRKGDRVVQDGRGEEGIVARDVSLMDRAMDVNFDGEIEEVSIEGWRRK